MPSQTELLWHLGLRDEIAGITRFCVNPPELRKLARRVGGTKKVRMEAIEEIGPGLILGNKEENTREEIERLRQRYPVWLSDIAGLPAALQMISATGLMLARQEAAQKLLQQIEEGFARLERLKKPARVLYFIWQKPYMVAGKDTFIDDMLCRCGFENAATDSRYPELSEEEIRSLSPEVVLLSSEPFPFKQRHEDAIRELLPGTFVKRVDGELFSWYGSRLLHSPPYFAELLQAFRQFAGPGSGF